MVDSAFRLPLAMVAVALALAPQSGRADQELIDYRQAVMESIGGHAAALAAIVKGDVPYTQDAAVHARAIEPLAKMAQHVFPPDSRNGETKALPAIWEKPEKFQQVLATFQTSAADLAKVADGQPRDLAVAFSDLAKACKGCHDDFRKKD